MAVSTITSKGQITIPVKMRKDLGLKPGVRIDFYKVEDGEYVFRPRNGSIMDLRGCVPPLDHAVTIKEMDQAVRDYVAELDRATMSSASGQSPYEEVA